MNPQHQISKETIAQEFKELVKGKMEQGLIDEAVESLFGTATAYPATLNIVELVLRLKFQIHITEPTGKTFNGDAFEAATPGAGVVPGQVFTPNLNKLYRDTEAFVWSATPVFTGLYFMTSNGGLLGHAQFGSTVVLGGGAGKGHWS